MSKRSRPKGGKRKQRQKEWKARNVVEYEQAVVERSEENTDNGVGFG